MSKPINGPPEPCGAKHPRYAGVTCVRIGQCWDGMEHMGIVTNPNRLPDEQRQFVYWGGASMEMDRHAMLDRAKSGDLL